MWLQVIESTRYAVLLSRVCSLELIIGEIDNGININLVLEIYGLVDEAQVSIELTSLIQGCINESIFELGIVKREQIVEFL